MNDTEDIHGLTLVLVQTLDLDIEHRLGVNFVAKGRLNVVRQALLVALLDGSPLPLEARVVDVLEQALELVEVLEELAFRDAQGLLDEVAKARVALVKPATRSDTVRNVEEPLRSDETRRLCRCELHALARPIELHEVLHDGLLQELTVKLGDTVDLAAPYCKMSEILASSRRAPLPMTARLAIRTFLGKPSVVKVYQLPTRTIQLMAHTLDQGHAPKPVTISRELLLDRLQEKPTELLLAMLTSQSDVYLQILQELYSVIARV